MALRYPPLAPNSDFPPPPEAPGVRTSESPVDHALTLLLAGEVDAALRWAAAALERTSSTGALIVTARLLDQMGRSRAAIDGLRLAVQQAVDASNLPLAVAAIDDLRHIGIDVSELLDYVASSFCRGSVRLQRGDGPPQLPASPSGDFVQPLSPFLAGPPLASRATQILQNAKRQYDEAVGAELPRLTPLPAFSALTREALYELLGAFQTITVPAGHRVIQEGVEGMAAYVVARGEVEISRRAAHGDNKFTLALARLGSGAFFGEMAMMSALPSPSSATATRPSILLVAKRDTLVSIATTRTEVAAQLAAHCRRNSLANLGWTSPVVAAVPPAERANMVERLEMRIFEKGDRLVTSGEDAPGLHVVVSGEVAIVAREWDERVLLATLGAGETVGEMELVLCRQSFADAIAIRPTATLFLSRDEYTALVQDYPAILHGLYAIAVQRHAETNFALQSGSAVVADDWLLETANAPPGPAPAMAQQAAPPAPLPAAVPRTATPTLQGLQHPSEPPPAADPIPSRRPSALPPVRPAANMPTNTMRMPSVTMPLPASAMPLPPVSGPPPNSTPMSSSLRPTVNSDPPPGPFGWIGPAAAGAAVALAAGVTLILAMQSRQPASSAAPGQADGLPRVTDLAGGGAAPTAAATVAAPPSAPAPVALPTPSLPSPAVADSSPAPAASAAPAPASKAPVQPRVTSPRTVVVVHPAAAPAMAAPAPAAAASGPPSPVHPATPAEPPASLASGQGADEFGGRQ